MKVKILVILIFMFVVYECQAQLFHKKINRWDDTGNRHGKWIEYWDETQTTISGKGKYNHGDLKGKWRYFHLNGERRLRFRYFDDRIKVAYFDNFGQIEKKGWARIEHNETMINYYWEGWWKEFDTHRHVTREIYFEKGKEVEVVEEKTP